MPSILGLTNSSFDPASRVRFIQFMPYLESAGWTVCHRPNRPDRQWKSPLPGRWLPAVHYRMGRIVMKANRLRDIRAARDFDLVFMNRDLAGKGLFLERRLLRNNARLVFDFDDAIFQGPNESAVRWMCRNAAWVTPGNEYLAAYARRFTDRVSVLPTLVDTNIYTPRSYAASPVDGPVRVGWTGSDQSIRYTLVPFLEILEELGRLVPFELVVISNTKPDMPVNKLRWRFQPWTPETEGRLEESMDIGLMPLVDDDFQRGKCGLKLLQYMAAGLATVASPVGVNKEITQHGHTGFLAASGREWHEALSVLILSPQLRAAMGQAGRKRCEAEYSVLRWMPVILDLFAKLSGRPPRSQLEENHAKDSLSDS
jgi:glycosyltransferase involved in cell wall biosynthesis